MPTLPIGAVCVASAIQETGKHIVQIADLPSDEPAEKNLRPLINRFFPDCIALSVRNIDDQNIVNPVFLLNSYKDIVSACRKLSSVPVILGGSGFSLYPDEILLYLDADFGITGEGEIVMPQLLENLNNNTPLSHLPNVLVKGIKLSQKKYFPVRINTLPAMNPELWPCTPEKRNATYLPFQSRRGCPFNCTYCPNTLIEGYTLRKRSVEMVVESIISHVSNGYRKFYFTDNVFNLPLSYSKELCRQIIRSGVDISWVCSIYPKTADDSLAELMAQAGCEEINLSFESGNNQILENMNKKFTIEEVGRVANIFKRYGIKQTGFVLLGGPGETKQTVEETLAFTEKLGLDTVNLTLGMRIYPGTTLSKIAVEKGFTERGDSLLRPVFYLEKELRNWIFDRAASWLKVRPNWQCAACASTD